MKRIIKRPFKIMMKSIGKWRCVIVAVILTAGSTVTATTVYEDAEDESIARWEIYDANPAGAVITNVIDNERGSRVIDFSGSGKDNGYRTVSWSNSSEFSIEWSMKYSENVSAFVTVVTSAGVKTMVYSPVNDNDLGDGDTVHHGLGDSVYDGTWRTFMRDIQADLSEAQPGVTIQSVIRFLIRGSGRVDDIKLFSQAGNTAPVAYSQNVNASEDAAESITLSGGDADNDQLTYSIVGNPEFGELSGTPPNLIYTPHSDYFGADSFYFKVNDGKVDSSIAKVSISVAVNHAPIAYSQNICTSKNTAKNIALTGNDADNDQISYSIVSNPTHGALSGTLPNITYTPSNGYKGNDRFTFKVNDGQADSRTATVSLTVGTIIYEDAEDESAARWEIYDADPAGASVNNVMDTQRGSRVIEFTGSGMDNGYRTAVWNNSNEFDIEWSMKYSENFSVSIAVVTSAGNRTMTYTPVDYDNLGQNDVIHHGLGSNATDGSWRTFTRDLQADLSEAQPGTILQSVERFIIHGSGRLDDIKLFAHSVYEDAEDMSIARWEIYDNDPAGATITNVFDSGRSSRVIEFTGSAKDNGYRTVNWDNGKEFCIKWSMKYSEDFSIFVTVTTSAGVRTMIYRPVDTDGLGQESSVNFGLGSDADDGSWRTFTRDLQNDLSRAQPGVIIQTVVRFLIRGSGRVDDIELFSQSSDIKLATSGATTYEIIVSDQATAVDEYAANTLSGYLEQITGAEFSVVSESNAGTGGKIFVGTEDTSGLGNQEYVVKSLGQDIFLYGEGKHGSLNAVMYFLENKLGWRWFSQHQDPVMPSNPSLKLKSFDVKRANSFESRHLIVRWQNYDFFYQNGINDGLESKFRLAGTTKPDYLVSYRPHELFVHSSFSYIPPTPDTPGADRLTWNTTRNYFSTNPEYFTLNTSNVRVPDRQLCFSNSALRAELTSKVMTHLSLKGTDQYITIDIADNSGELCHCAGCLALVEAYQSPGGPIYDYLLELCATMSTTHPGVMIKTLSYHLEQTRIPPVLPGAGSLPDNLLISFAPAEDCYFADWTHPDSNMQRTYYYFKEWVKLASTHPMVWIYPNPWNTGEVMPVGNVERVVNCMKTIYDAGGRGFFADHCGYTNRTGFAELQAYIMMKLGQDIDKNPDTIIKEYTDYMFGDAASLVRTYIEELEDGRKAMTVLPPDVNIQSWEFDLETFPYLTVENIYNWENDFDTMISLINAEPPSDLRDSHLLNVQLMRRELDYAVLWRWFDLKTAYPAYFTDYTVFSNRILAANGVYVLNEGPMDDFIAIIEAGE